MPMTSRQRRTIEKNIGRIATALERILEAVLEEPQRRRGEERRRGERRVDGKRAARVASRFEEAPRGGCGDRLWGYQRRQSDRRLCDRINT
jgi:hypothetical protein